MRFRPREQHLGLIVVIVWLSAWTVARPSIKPGHDRLHRNHQRRLPAVSTTQYSAHTSTAVPHPTTVYPQNAAQATSIVVPVIRSNTSEQRLSSTAPDMDYLPDQSAPEVWLPLTMQSLNAPVDSLTNDFAMSPASGSLLVRRDVLEPSKKKVAHYSIDQLHQRKGSSTS